MAKLWSCAGVVTHSLSLLESSFECRNDVEGSLSCTHDCTNFAYSIQPYWHCTADEEESLPRLGKMLGRTSSASQALVLCISQVARFPGKSRLWPQTSKLICLLTFRDYSAQFLSERASPCIALKPTKGYS